MTGMLDVTGMLDGLRVLDLGTRVAGACCSKALADLGADVIKIEDREQGDPIRYQPPLLPGFPSCSRSSLHQFFNANKRSLTLDLRTRSGQDLLRQLVKSADILVETFKPGYLEGLGLGFEVLRGIQPRLTMVSITPFGQTGPRAGDEGDDIVCQALSGLLYLSGELAGTPTYIPIEQAEATAGRYGAVAALAYALDPQPSAHHVDVAITESATTIPPWHILFYTYMGVVVGWTRTRNYKVPMDGDFLRCKDGHVCLTTMGNKPIENWVVTFELPELIGEGFDAPKNRVDHWQRLQALFEEKLGQTTRAEFFSRAAKDGLVVGIVQRPDELLACPQLNARQAFSAIPFEGGAISVPGPGFLADGLNPAPVLRPAPRLGEHTEEILRRELGIPASDKRAAAGEQAGAQIGGVE